MTTDKIASGLVFYLGFLIAITFYQATLALIAMKKGDHSQTTVTRASFVPFVHMELFGTVLFPLLTIISGSPVVFGWPKPFQINTRYLKRPKQDLNIIYASALASIFIAGIICMIILRFIGGPSIFNIDTTFSSVSSIIQLFLTVIGQVCFTIGALFILPMPGTAGWFLLLNNASYELSRKLIQSSFMITIIALFLIIAGLLNVYFKFFLYLFYTGAMG